MPFFYGGIMEDKIRGSHSPMRASDSLILYFWYEQVNTLKNSIDQKR